MSRAEPCPVPGCLDFKARSLPLCRHHWRALHFAQRRLLDGLWHRLIHAKQSGDDAGFVAAARLFLEFRRGAVAAICQQEHIHECH